MRTRWHAPHCPLPIQQALAKVHFLVGRPVGMSWTPASAISRSSLLRPPRNRSREVSAPGKSAGLECAASRLVVSSFRGCLGGHRVGFE